MKFLAHGDSVVSLRFKYLETGSPDSPNLTVDRNNRVPTDAERDLAIGKLDEVAMLLDQYSGNETDFGSDPNELAGIGKLVAYCRQYLQGELNSTDLATLESVESRFGALAGEVPDYLTNSDYLPPIGEILPSVGTTEELFGLMDELAPQADKMEAVSAFGLELAEFRNDTAELLTAHAKINAEQGEAPNQSVAAYTGRKDEILAQMDTNRAPVENYLENLVSDTEDTLGSAAMAAGLETYRA